jgi:hypothetical protein
MNSLTFDMDLESERDRQNRNKNVKNILKNY